MVSRQREEGGTDRRVPKHSIQSMPPGCLPAARRDDDESPVRSRPPVHERRNLDFLCLWPALFKHHGPCQSVEVAREARRRHEQARISRRQRQHDLRQPAHRVHVASGCAVEPDHDAVVISKTRRASRTSAEGSSTDLDRLTQSKGLNKPVLVGLTGFEPATP